MTDTAKNYRVLVTRDVTESTTVEVSAKTPLDAEFAALDKLAGMTDAEWHLDDGSWNNGNTYVTAVDPAD